jgi:hypothetical protein
MDFSDRRNDSAVSRTMLTSFSDCVYIDRKSSRCSSHLGNTSLGSDSPCPTALVSGIDIAAACGGGAAVDPLPCFPPAPFLLFAEAASAFSACSNRIASSSRERRRRSSLLAGPWGES